MNTQNALISQSVDLSHLSPKVDTDRVRSAVKLVFDDKLNLGEAALFLGVSKQRVHQIIHNSARLEVPNYPRVGRNHPILTDKEKLSTALAENLTIVQTAESLGCKTGNVYSWINFHNINYKPVRPTGRRNKNFKSGFYMTKADGTGRARVLCSLFGYAKINPDWCSTQHTINVERVLIECGLLGAKLPAGFELHHIDGNPLHNHPSNLAVVTRLQHRRLHILETTLLEQLVTSGNAPKRSQKLVSLLNSGMDDLARGFHEANLTICKQLITMQNMKKGKLFTRFPDKQMELYEEIRALAIRAGYAYLFSNLVLLENEVTEVY